MSQLTFNDGDLLSVVRGVINGNAGDVENRVGNVTVFRTTADILSATTDEGDSGNARGLSSGTYLFDNALDVGVLHFVLTDVDGFYTITSNSFSTVTYTGTLPFFTNGAGITGNSLILINIIFTTATATCIDVTAGNSLIFKLAVFGGCQKVATYSGGFFTVRGTAIVACGDGVTCNDVGTIQADTYQVTSGQDIGGSGLSVTGTGDVLILSGADSRLGASEFFIDIDSTYTGSVSLVGGSDSGVGTFFKGSRDQFDVDVSTTSIKGIENTKNFIDAHLTGNAAETIISVVSTPVKINATWIDGGTSRFTFDASGRWTYTGKENITLSATIIATIDPVGGGTDTVDLYFAKNGVFVPSSKGEASASAGAQVSSIILISMTTGDYLEGFVANASDTSNLVITTASFDAIG